MKTKRRMICVAAWFATALTAVPAAAQLSPCSPPIRPGRIAAVGVSVGRSVSNERNAPHAGSEFRVSAEGAITNCLAIRADYGVNRWRIDGKDPAVMPGDSVRVSHLTVSVVRRSRRMTPVQLYGALGAGVYRFRYDLFPAPLKSKRGVFAGFGLDVLPTNHVTVNVELRIDLVAGPGVGPVIAYSFNPWSIMAGVKLRL